MSAISIVARLKVKPECKEEVLKVVENLVAESRKESGNIHYDLYQDIADPNTMIILEAWKSKAAIDEHNASPHFTAFKEFSAGKVTSLEVNPMLRLI